MHDNRTVERDLPLIERNTKHLIYGALYQTTSERIHSYFSSLDHGEYNVF